MCALFGAASGRAQPSPADRQLAQSLFDRARELMEKDDFKAACPLLAESQRLDPAGGTLINLALCHERIGKLATAHLEFNEALSQAIREGRKDRQQIAEERIAAIVPKLSRIAIDLAPGADQPTLVVRLDGVEVPKAALAAPAAVDGGRHRVDASAAGRAPWSKEVDVAPTGDLVRVTVPALREHAAALGRVCASGTTLQGDACVPSGGDSGGATRTYLGAGALTVGGISLAAGFVTGFVALFQAIELSSGCDDSGRCPARLQGTVDAYYAWGTASTVTFIAGGALIGAGIGLLVSVPSRNKTAPVAVGPHGLVGRF